MTKVIKMTATGISTKSPVENNCIVPRLMDDYHDDNKNNSNCGKKVEIAKVTRSVGGLVFRNHLRNMSLRTQSKKTLANRMDDELKRMESRYYRLPLDSDEECALPKCYYPPRYPFIGPTVQPDVHCYAIVANAYAKAGLERVGAELAEDVLHRCEAYLTTSSAMGDQRPNAVLKTACLNAWVKADDWGKADEWIKTMEEEYAFTKEKRDAPYDSTYKCYLNGLMNSKVLSADEITHRSREMLQNMHTLYDSGRNPFARPNRYTYIAAMKCEAVALREGRKNNGRLQQQGEGAGIEVFQQVKKLMNQWKEFYDKTGYTDMEPNVFTYIPVFNAAAHCQGGIETAREAEELLAEVKNFYTNRKEGSSYPDYLPLDMIYTACFTAYARVPMEHAKEASKRVEKLLRDLESDSTRPSPAVQVYTAAINAMTLYRDSRSAQKGEQILRRLPRPDSIAYQCVIKAYARIGNAIKADELLWELQKLASQKEMSLSSDHQDKEEEEGRYRTKQPYRSNNRQIKEAATLDPPDVITVAACIHAWVKANNTIIDQKIDGSVLDRTDNLLKLIIKSYQDNHDRNKKSAYRKRHVETWVFEEVARLWSISRRRDAGKRVEELMATMKDLNGKLFSNTASSRNTQTISFAPSFNMYILALDAWANSGHKNAAKNAMQLLQTMQDLFDEGKLEHGINIRALSSALASVTKSAGSEGRGIGNSSNLAEKLFAKIVHLHEQGDRSAPVNPRTLTCVLSAIIKSSDSNAPLKAMELLRKMRNISIQNKKYYKQEKIGDDNNISIEKNDFCANTIVYNCVLNGLAKRGMVKEAEELLQEMKQHTTRRKKHYNNSSYYTHNNNDDDNDCSPNIVSYSCVCAAYANSQSNSNDNDNIDGDDNGSNHDDVNNSKHISLRITTNRAEKILSQIEERYKQGEKQLKPDVFMYNSVLASLANDARTNPQAAERASQLLSKMEMSSIIVGDDDDHDNTDVDHKVDSQIVVFPDLISYSTVCQAHAISNVPNAAEKAEAILLRAETLALKGSISHPDIIFYSSLVLALSKTKTPKSLFKAEELIHRMEKKLSIHPNTHIYNILLSGWARSRVSYKLREVNRLFQKMKQTCTSGCNDNCCPDVYSHNWVILAAARSPSKSLTKARGHFNTVLARFRDLHLLRRHCDNAGQSLIASAIFDTNATTTYTAINDCSNTTNKNTINKTGDNYSKKSIIVRVQNQQEQQQQQTQQQAAKANSYTYSYFFKACKTLLPESEDRQKMATQAFELCIQNGQMSKQAFKEAMKLIPAFVVRKRFQEHHQTQEHQDEQQNQQYTATTINNNENETNAFSSDIESKEKNDVVINYSSVPKEWSCNVQRRHI